MATAPLSTPFETQTSHSSFASIGEAAHQTRRMVADFSSGAWRILDGNLSAKTTALDFLSSAFGFLAEAYSATSGGKLLSLGKKFTILSSTFADTSGVLKTFKLLKRTAKGLSLPEAPSMSAQERLFERVHKAVKFIFKSIRECCMIAMDLFTRPCNWVHKKELIALGPYGKNALKAVPYMLTAVAVTSLYLDITKAESFSKIDWVPVAIDLSYVALSALTFAGVAAGAPLAVAGINMVADSLSLYNWYRENPLQKPSEEIADSASESEEEAEATTAPSANLGAWASAVAAKAADTDDGSSSEEEADSEALPPSVAA